MKFIVAAWSLVFALAAASPAAGQGAGLRSFTVTYTVRARGIEVGEASYAFTFQGADYQATSSRRMTGMARMMMGTSQDFTYSARGQIGADGQIRPSAYQHQGGRGNRMVRVSFTPSAVTTVATPRMGMGHPPATAEQKLGAIDQLSIFAQMLTASGDPCRQTLRVFMDGRTRFDLALSPNGRTPIALPSFHGQAYRCAVQFTPIAGFSDPQQPAQLTFLFASSNGYFVPIQIEMPTDDVGLVRLQARSFTVAGAR